MAQEIGLSAKFDTRQFSRGLLAYQRGLAKAETETARVASAINLSAQQIANAWKQASAAPSVALLALQQLSNAIQHLGGAVLATGQSLQTFTAAFAGLAQVTNTLTTRLQKLGVQYNTANRSLREFRDGLRQSTTATLAAAAAITTVLVLAFRRMQIAIRNAVSEGIELVRFFERAQLALNFFAARSARASDSSLSLNDALSQTRRESQGLLIWLQKIAIASPFTSKDVVQAFRVAQAYGLLAEDAKTLVPLLLDLGAAVGLDPETLENAARALGQIQARGKLTGEEIRQLGNAGIPIRDILVKELGIAANQFDSLLEAGAITADVTIPAIVRSLQEFEGAGERVAFETIGGMISAFEELRQVGTARFFEGIFEPLRQTLLDFINVANDLETIAWFRVIGEDIGNLINNGINKLIEGVNGLIKSWKELDPVLKSNIVTFVTTTAAVSALAIALGATALVARLVIRPFTLLIVSFAALNVVWQNLSDSVDKGAKAIIGKFQDMLSAAGSFVIEFATLFSDIGLYIADVFADIIVSIAKFGANVVTVFAEGILGSASILNAALGSLSSIFTFWLAPGSPPRVAPDIDSWGYYTMAVEYAKGISEGVQQIPERLDPIGKLMKNSIDISIKESKLSDAGAFAAEEVTDGWLRGQKPQIIRNYLSDYWEGLANEMPDLAEPLVESAKETANLFWDGFLEEFPKPIPRVNEEVQAILGQIGAGTRLSLEGALLIERYLEGFKDADYSALDEITGIIGNRLSSLADLGKISDIDVPNILSDTREELAQAIDEFRRFGSVSADQFEEIRKAAGVTGDVVVEYIQKYLDLAKAANNTESAQDSLNQTIEYYKNLITPVREELEALQRVTSNFSDQRQILELQRTIANEATSQLAKEEAAAKIAEIRAKARLTTLESERDSAVGVAEDRLAGEEEVQSEIEAQLKLMRNRFELQNKQVAEVAKESSIIQKLRDEAERLSGKEESQLELQLKFAKLLNEEERDRLEEARARYVLNQADSTEFEKQQAILTLQTIELNRQRRDIEAANLGFDPALFQPIRDAIITLDDLNIKTGEAGGAFDDLFEQITSKSPEATELLAEWETALANVETKYKNIRGEFLTTVQQINDNLPAFLRLFPEEEGGEPPILTNLRKMQGLIIGLAAVMTATNILIKLAALKSALTGLGLVSLSSKVVAVFAAIGGAIAGLASAIASFGGILAAAVALWVTNFLHFRDRVTGSLTNVVRTFFGFLEIIGNMAKIAKQLIDSIFTSEGREQVRADFEQLRQDIRDQGFGEAIKGDLSLKEAGKEVIGTFVEGATEGLALNPFGGLVAVYNESLNDAVNGVDSEALATQMATNVETAFGAQNERFAGAVAGIFTSQAFKDKVVEEAGLAGQEVSNGIINGLVLDEIESRDKVTKFFDGIVAKFKERFGIESPSKEMEELVGIPIGEGIISGIGIALTDISVVDSISGLLEKIGGVVDRSNKSIATKFRLFNISFKLIMGDLETIIFESWTKNVETTTELWTELKEEVIRIMDELGKELDKSLAELELIVVGVFQEIRRGVATEVKGLSQDIIGYLITNQDSMLNVLKDALLGTVGPTGERGTDGIGYQIGVAITEGIAAGLNDPVTWATTLIPAIKLWRTNFEIEWNKEWDISSPSKVAATNMGIPIAQGIAVGILQGVPTIAGAVSAAINSGVSSIAGYGTTPSPASATGSIFNTASNTYNYNLNVNSASQSQGIINDFSIMRVLTT